MKRCSCGKEYDPDEWQNLPYVGVWDLGIGTVLSLRNCSCGSTLAVEEEIPDVENT